MRNYKANQSANVVDNLDFNSDDENDSSPRNAEYYKKRRPGHQDYYNAWSELLRIFPTGFWRDKDRLPVPYGLVNVASRAAREMKVVTAICMIVFRVLPVRPEKTKWTKLGLCLDFHLVAMGFCLVLQWGFWW